jgi:hypothetical protein
MRKISGGTDTFEIVEPFSHAVNRPFASPESAQRRAGTRVTSRRRGCHHDSHGSPDSRLSYPHGCRGWQAAPVLHDGRATASGCRGRLVLSWRRP